MNDSFLDFDAADPDATNDIILLEHPVLDADELIEDEVRVDENDIETEQVVLLDTLRLDDIDLA